jgi:hypothetical protein
MKMEKKEPRETHPKTTPDGQASASGSEEMAERIKTMIREMPQVKPPAGLLLSVMEAVKAERVSPWLRVYRWATSPRSITFTPLRLAFVTALSLLLVFSALLLHEREDRNIALDEELIPVEFALDMPDAHSVHVAGSFNNWVPQPCELHNGNGSSRWMLTLPLKPGRYEYAFIVDGKHTPHPHAQLYQDDGFGNQNTVLTLVICAPFVPGGVHAQNDEASVIHAVEEARKAGVPDGTMNRLFQLGHGKGVEHASMTNLLRIVGEVKMEGLPLGPFVSKIEEGIAKRVPAETIERVLSEKRQDYRFARSVTADYLKKHGLRQQVTPEDLIGITESLYSGLSRQDLALAMEEAPAVSFSTLKEAVILRASLKQVGFDQKLSDWIVLTGLKHNFFTSQQCDFTRAIVAGKRKGVSDAEIAEAVLSTMQSGGTVTDLRSQIGVSISDMGQYTP